MNENLSPGFAAALVSEAIYNLDPDLSVEELIDFEFMYCAKDM